MTEKEQEDYRLGIPQNSLNIIRNPLFYTDIETMEERIPDLLLCDDSPIPVSDLLLILASIATYISQEELNLICQTNTWTVRNTLNALIKKHKLKKVSGQYCGSTRAYYHLTPSGWNEAYALMADNLCIPYSPKKNSNQLVHKYGAGMNVFQMILAGSPCIWGRETMLFGNGINRGNEDSLWADMFCYAWIGQSRIERRIYFEEDTGSENFRTLYKKIINYGISGRMEYPQEMLIFSFISKSAKLKPIEKEYLFSNSKIEFLRDILYKSNRETLQQIAEEDPTKRGADLCHIYTDYLNTPLTREFLTKYLNSLKHLRNPWQIAAHNAGHRKLALRSLRYMASNLISKAAQDMSRAHTRMLYGFQVLFSATPLVADIMPWACLDVFPENQHLISSSIDALFPGMSYISNITDNLYSSQNDTYSINMRNCFSSGKGGILSVEFLGFDLSAWLRTWYLARIFDKAPPISVLCVFDTKDQVNDFCARMGFSPAKADMPQRGFYGIYRYDLGKEGKIFFFCPKSPHNL